MEIKRTSFCCQWVFYKRGWQKHTAEYKCDTTAFCSMCVSIKVGFFFSSSSPLDWFKLMDGEGFWIYWCLSKAVKSSTRNMYEKSCWNLMLLFELLNRAALLRGPTLSFSRNPLANSMLRGIQVHSDETMPGTPGMRFRHVSWDLYSICLQRGLGMKLSFATKLQLTKLSFAPLQLCRVQLQF